MSRQFLQSLLLFFCLTVLLVSSFAQESATTELENGYRFDHPAEWVIVPADDSDNLAYFRDGTMDGLIIIVDTDRVSDNAQDNLEEVFDTLDRTDRNNGDFEEPYEEYEIGSDWEVVRAMRVRENDRRLEYFVMATSPETSVFVRGSLRRGDEDTYLPEFDAIIASVRTADDEGDTSTATLSCTASLGVSRIGTENESLEFEPLSERYLYEDGSYEFCYPAGWQMRLNDDGSIRFVNREGTTLFGTLRFMERGENTAETALAAFLSTETGYSEIQSFSLNGYPAARAYRENTRGGTSEVAMAVLRSSTITIMTAASNTGDFALLEPLLRGVLYTYRPAGSPLELSLVGTGARSALSSAFIYGTSVTEATSNTVTAPENQPQTAIPLSESFETSNGDYRLNYPADWTQAMEQNTIVLSNREEYELFRPESGEVQMMIFFIDRIRNLDIDEFSPESLLEYIIANDASPDYWEDINEFSSLGRRGAFADYVGPRVNWTMRTFLVELDAEELVYARMDMVARDNDIDEFQSYALAILETVDFAD